MSDFRGNNDPLNLYDEEKGEICNNLKEPKEDENVKDWSWSSIPIDCEMKKKVLTCNEGKKIPLTGDWWEMEHEKELYEQTRPKML